MDRARPPRLEDPIGIGHGTRQLLGRHDGAAEGGEGGHHGLLVGDLMQPAAALAEVVAGIDAAEHQHGHGIGEGLADGGAGVHHPRTGDQDANAGLARGAGIAVGHESRPLLMAHADVADAALGQAFVEIEGMDARNAEDGVDATGLEKGDGRLAACLIDAQGYSPPGLAGTLPVPPPRRNKKKKKKKKKKNKKKKKKKKQPIRWI